MQLFTIEQSKKNYSVQAIVDYKTMTVSFIGTINGVTFTKGKKYEIIRARVLKALEINTLEVQ